MNIETKIAAYKALRSVREKMARGQFMLMDEKQRPMTTEMLFLVGRVSNAVAAMEIDSDLAETKANLDQSQRGFS